MSKVSPAPALNLYPYQKRWVSTRACTVLPQPCAGANASTSDVLAGRSEAGLCRQGWLPATMGGAS